jgi:hypothetical protein
LRERLGSGTGPRDHDQPHACSDPETCASRPEPLTNPPLHVVARNSIPDPSTHRDPQARTDLSGIITTRRRNEDDE